MIEAALLGLALAQAPFSDDHLRSAGIQRDPASSLRLFIADDAAGGGSAHRASARVALLPVLVDAGDGVSASAIFRLVSKQMTLRKTLSLMSIDEFFFNEGGGRADQVLACGSDTRCVARQLAPFQADLGLVVIVNGQIDPPLVGLLTIDTRRERPIAEKYQQVSRTKLWTVLNRTLADHLDQAGHPSWGQLRVDVEPAGASIQLSPPYAPEAGRPNLFVVPPGRYVVSAEFDGFSRDETETRIEAGASHYAALQLEAESDWYESPWLWVTAAVVIATSVTVAAIALSPEETTCGCVITADQPVCPPCP